MDLNFVCNSYIEIFSLLRCYAACIRLRRRLFREWEVVERVELKIDGMYQVQDILHHRKSILYFHGKYFKKSRRLTVRTTTYLFLLTLQSAVLYTVTTNCHSSLPCPLPFTVCWDLMPCLPNYTASH